MSVHKTSFKALNVYISLNKMSGLTPFCLLHLWVHVPISYTQVLLLKETSTDPRMNVYSIVQLCSSYFSFNQRFNWDLPNKT